MELVDSRGHSLLGPGTDGMDMSLHTQVWQDNTLAQLTC
jgi:hypothetical protein